MNCGRRDSCGLRIDGEVHDIDSLPKLQKNKKHTVEVVVDSLKISPESKQRLAESFETALRHADGRALAVEMDSGQEHLFSAKFSCPVCSYSLPELEPRLFSFNNPMGACPKCDGLGKITFFDPSGSSPSRIYRWLQARSRDGTGVTSFIIQILASLASHYDFDLEVPFEQLSRRIPRISSSMGQARKKSRLHT